MRYAGMLLGTLLMSCDMFWTPICLDDPTATGCQIEYRAVPDYSVAYAKQSWLLQSTTPNQDKSLHLSDYQSFISTTTKYGEKGIYFEQKLKIRNIENSGNIEIEDDCLTNNCAQKFTDTAANFTMTIGNAKPLTILLNGVDLGCAAQSGYVEKFATLGGGMSPWIGLRAFSKQAAFMTSEASAVPGFYSLNNNYINDKIVPEPDLEEIDSICLPIVTRNFVFKYCPNPTPNNAGIYRVNKLLTIKASCNSIDTKKLYCPDFDIIQFAASSVDDVIVVAGKSNLEIIKLLRTGNEISHKEFKIFYSAQSTPRVLSFADLDFDGLSDLVLYREDGSLYVYLQQSGDQPFIFSDSFTNLLKNALERAGAVDPQPVRAIVAGDFFKAKSLQLILAKGANLWLVALDAELNKPPLPGVQPAGTVRLESPFAEPAERLEVGDLNGDGRPDLAYVAKSAAYFCLTQVVGK